MTSWKDMIESRQAALTTLPGYAPFPADNLTWTNYADRIVADLLTFDDCWFIDPAAGIKGFRPYVKGTDQWGGATRTREITELMAMMDVLGPLFRYLQLNPNAERQALVDEFIGELPKFYNAAVKQSPNRPDNTHHDSWYFMENAVLKYGHLFMISEAEVLAESTFGNLGSAIDMTHRFKGLFPQFVSLADQPITRRNTQNYSTAGLLAYALITATQLTGDSAYLKEAEEALLAMRAVDDPRQLIYEPQELTAAAAAAAQLIQYADQLGSTTDFVQLAQDFFYAQMQMLYTDGGKIDLDGFQPVKSEWLPPTWRDGLFVPYYNPVESGGINAPAFKENFEAVMWWVDYLKVMVKQPGFVATDALKVLNLNRIKNFYFFSPNIPDAWEREYGATSLQYIPYEDIDYYDVRDHEDESVRKLAGYNGKEIYGAGEGLCAYFLFEALGKASDGNAMIVNLNTFDKTYPPEPENRAFLVFNPHAREAALTFELTHLDAPYTLFVDATQHGHYQPGESFTLRLPSNGSAVITLEGNP